MGSDHPTYPNPTVVEALCEVHFVPAADRPWSPNRPTTLYKNIEDQFPDMEVVPEAALKIELSERGPRQQIEHTGNRIRFFSSDKTRSIQISGDVLVHNFLAPYPGWLEVKAGIVRVWKQAHSVLCPTSISRLGLRYINRIEHTKKARQLSDWLKPTSILPEGLINSAPGYSAMLDIRLDEQHRLVENIRYLDPTQSPPFGATIFDIYRFWIGNSDASEDSLSGLINQLHDDIWEEFNSAKTELLLKKLETKPA